MSYLTLKEASDATGLSEATVRRLCKKPGSKAFVQMKKGKQGTLYTIQANYLFDTYPPAKPDKIDDYTRVHNDYARVDKEPIQAYTALLAAKDEIIELLKSETVYLRAENTSLREENREIKLLPAPAIAVEDEPIVHEPDRILQPGRKSLWQRLFS